MGTEMIAVIGATHAELRGVLALMRNTKRVTQSLPLVYEGFLAGAKTAVILSGIGKINAVNAMDYLFGHHSVDTIFSVGVAGALDPMLQKGDMVIGSSLMCLESYENSDHSSDPALMELALGCCGDFSQACHVGKLLTVPSMVTSTSEKAELRKKFDALAVDMETCHIARAASSRNIRFLALRAISDPAAQSINVDFGRLRKGSISKWLYFLSHPGAYAAVRKFRRDITHVSNRCASVLEAVVNSMAEVPDRSAG